MLDLEPFAPSIEMVRTADGRAYADAQGVRRHECFITRWPSDGAGRERTRSLTLVCRVRARAQPGSSIRPRADLPLSVWEASHRSPTRRGECHALSSPVLGVDSRRKLWRSTARLSWCWGYRASIGSCSHSSGHSQRSTTVCVIGMTRSPGRRWNGSRMWQMCCTRRRSVRSRSSMEIVTVSFGTCRRAEGGDKRGTVTCCARVALCCGGRSWTCGEPCPTRRLVFPDPARMAQREHVRSARERSARISPSPWRCRRPAQCVHVPRGRRPLDRSCNELLSIVETSNHWPTRTTTPRCP